jgi:hypothetical protein
MKPILYERWDWEFDLGVNPLPEGRPLPASFTAAFHDRLGRLYRVEIHEPVAGQEGGRRTSSEIYVYDYFCDAEGRVIQKRSLGPGYEVQLIVDYEYDQNGSQVTETAWWPISGTCKSLKRPLPMGRRGETTEG